MICLAVSSLSPTIPGVSQLIRVVGATDAVTWATG